MTDVDPFGRGRVRRLFGLDRSGPKPRQTRKGEPLNPWTIPNAIGFARLALVPVIEARRRSVPLDAVTETPRLTAARRFHSWRDRPNDTISRREREDHLRRLQLRAREMRRASRA